MTYPCTWKYRILFVKKNNIVPNHRSFQCPKKGSFLIASHFFSTKNIQNKLYESSFLLFFKLKRFIWILKQAPIIFFQRPHVFRWHWQDVTNLPWCQNFRNWKIGLSVAISFINNNKHPVQKSLICHSFLFSKKCNQNLQPSWG